MVVGWWLVVEVEGVDLMYQATYRKQLIVPEPWTALRVSLMPKIARIESGLSRRALETDRYRWHVVSESESRERVGARYLDVVLHRTCGSHQPSP